MGGDLGSWHAGRPSSVDTYLGLRAAHRATAGWSSHLARTVLSRVPRAVDALPRSARTPADPATAQAVAELRCDGITMLDPVLSPDEVAALADFARRAPGRLRRTDGSVGRSTWHDRPDDAAALMLDGTFSWARPEVQRLMVDDRVLQLVETTTGMRPVVHPPQLYWSFPTPVHDGAAPALARQLHWDYDGIAGFRLHLYLTDVDEGTGPMEYAAGTHRPGSLGWHRPSTDQYAPVADGVLRDRRVLTGPAGTSFLTNPHGLHQATTPTRGERLFLVLPIQGGGYGGYYRRVRALPVRDAELGRRLADGDPALRLFEAADPSATAATLVRG